MFWHCMLHVCANAFKDCTSSNFPKETVLHKEKQHAFSAATPFAADDFFYLII